MANLTTFQLFAGHPSLKIFSLWSPTATFADPISVAEGSDRYKAQWYGLPALFHPIKIQSHKVKSAGNPIEIGLTTTYTVKGIKKEQTIESIVHIYVSDDGKISKLEDRWNGKLPEGAVTDVSTDMQ